ncbi:MAG: hypothetical protein JWN75_1165 [Candidatus Saccharibacteria bacterium]|nr:hypothetical protein [Candidatus Saccharibacteria bacterium]
MSDELFYIDKDGKKTDADIHEFILSDAGPPPKRKPKERKPLDGSDKTN